MHNSSAFDQLMLLYSIFLYVKLCFKLYALSNFPHLSQKYFSYFCSKLGYLISFI